MIKFFFLFRSVIVHMSIHVQSQHERIQTTRKNNNKLCRMYDEQDKKKAY